MTNRILRSHEVTETLSSFVKNCQWTDIPEHARHEAKRSILNFFAVALAACSDPTIEKAVKTYLAFSANSTATLIGRPERTDILNAAALNAMSANVFDFDDTHIPTIIHPTSTVAPVLFAMAEQQPMTGTELLLAFILGVEVECRVGNAVSPGHYSRGWHITSTCGVFGSAAAAAKIMGLSARQITWAMGSASAQAGGLVETLGTMSKSVSVGNAARNGLLSTLLAINDFDGPAHPLEGERGFLHVTAEQPDIEKLISGLGQTWEVNCNTYKPYPCGVVLNPVIEACLRLTKDNALVETGFEHIQRIELTGHPLLRQRTDRPNIKTGRESQVSAQHAVAVSLFRGRAGMDEFSDSAVNEPALRSLGARVVFADDPSMPVEAARVGIYFDHLPNPLVMQIDQSKGSLANPMSDADIEDKLRTLCEQGGAGCSSQQIIETVWSLDTIKDVSALMALVVRH